MGRARHARAQRAVVCLLHSCVTLCGREDALAVVLPSLSLLAGIPAPALASVAPRAAAGAPLPLCVATRVAGVRSRSLFLQLPL